LWSPSANEGDNLCCIGSIAGSLSYQRLFVKAMTIFNLQEAATAYAKAAERILGEDADFLTTNTELVPVFVALLFQSIEISLKHLGIEAELFTAQEVRDKRLTKNGHGVKEIAELVNTKLGAQNNYLVITALTAGIDDAWKSEALQKMLFGHEFEATRQSYQSRNLGYLKLNQGDFAIVEGLLPWATAVREVAENLPISVRVVKQWKSSPGKSGHFAIWHQ